MKVLGCDTVKSCLRLDHKDLECHAVESGPIKVSMFRILF